MSGHATTVPLETRTSWWTVHIDRMAAVAPYLGIATCAVLPISTSVAEILAVTTLVLWACGGGMLKVPELLRTNSAAFATVLFFAWLMVAVSYTSGPYGEALSTLAKYRDLLYLPMFMLVFARSEHRLWGLWAFQFGMLITLAYSLAMPVFGLHSAWGFPENAAVFKNHITQNILMSFAAYLWARQAIASPAWRWVNATLALLAAFDVLCLVDGRTGYMTLAVGVLVLLFQNLGWRGIAAAIVLLMLAGAGLYTVSGGLRERVNLAADELQQFVTQKFRKDPSQQSIGLRMTFYKRGLTAVSRSPLIGVGTGSAYTETERLSHGETVGPTGNLHSEYLMALLQGGLVGLTLLFVMFAGQWFAASRTGGWEGQVGQLLVATMAAGCVVNSMLLDTTEGLFFGLLGGLAFAATYKSQSETLGVETTTAKTSIAKPHTVRVTTRNATDFLGPTAK